MVVFVDTSALYALMDGADPNHDQARQLWDELAETNRNEVQFVTTNYVILESVSLIQHRLGMDAVRDFQTSVVSPLFALWVSEGLHRLGVEQLLVSNRRQLSLVDCTTFAVMRGRSISHAFAFDHQFAEQGFTVLPQEEGV